MRKKVVILSNGLVRGGTDTFVVNLVKGLDKEKFDIRVILSVNGMENCTRVPEIIDTGAKVVKTCALNTFRNRWRHLIKLYRYLKIEKIDVFQTNIDLFNGPNMLIAWLAGVKVRVCHSHNTRQERAISDHSFKIRFYQNIMKALCWHFSNRRTGCSADAMTFLFGEKWKRDKHSLVVNNGIDIESFRTGIDVESKRKELGVSSKFQILTVGRIVKQKNPIFLERVFYELCEIRDDCELVWAGEGNLVDELKTNIKRHGIQEKVHLLGNRSDIPSIMQCSDLFFLPSVFEGLGIVLIEAQAAGLSCFASDSVPDEANCGGVYYISLQKDAKFWARILNNYLKNAEKPAINNKKLEQYSINNMVRQMEFMFE